jgi:hypothetical protein
MQTSARIAATSQMVATTLNLTNSLKIDTISTAMEVPMEASMLIVAQTMMNVTAQMLLVMTLIRHA